MRRFIGTVAVLIVSIPAYAQDGQISEEQARNFVNQAVQEARQLAQQGNWQGIQSWHQQHLASDAKLAMKAMIVAKDGPTVNIEGTFDRETLSRMGNKLMSNQSQYGPQSVQDFTLRVNVLNAMTLPRGGAAVQAVFHEAGTMAIPPADITGSASRRGAQQGGSADGSTGGSAGQSGQQAAQQGGPQRSGAQGPGERAVFQTASMCDLRLTRDGGEIRVSLAACNGITTID